MAGDDGIIVPHITCFKCNRRGHYSDHCPDDNGQGENGGQNIQQLQIGDETRKDHIMEETQ